MRPYVAAFGNLRSASCTQSSVRSSSASRRWMQVGLRPGLVPVDLLWCLLPLVWCTCTCAMLLSGSRVPDLDELLILLRKQLSHTVLSYVPSSHPPSCAAHQAFHVASPPPSIAAYLSQIRSYRHRWRRSGVTGTERCICVRGRSCHIAYNNRCTGRWWGQWW